MKGRQHGKSEPETDKKGRRIMWPGVLQSERHEEDIQVSDGLA